MPFVVMVAGPNGSGKTTLARKLRRSGIDLGRHINPDDIAALLSGPYDARVREAQRRAEAWRDVCLDAGESFSFETVMSHPSKIDVLRRARAMGYDTILYFVATEDPAVNVERVAQRVAEGGHDVPKERIVARYARTLAALPEAITAADRAFLFDNSGLGAEAPEGGPRLVAATKGFSGDKTIAIEAYPPTPRWVRRALGALDVTSSSA